MANTCLIENCTTAECKIIAGTDAFGGYAFDRELEIYCGNLNSEKPEHPIRKSDPALTRKTPLLTCSSQHHQDQHIQSALNEVTLRGIGIKAPPGHQEEGYASHLDCQDVTEQVGRYGSRFFLCGKDGKNLLSEKLSTQAEKP